MPFVCRLVVASPVVACLRLASHFVGQPPHASILDPSSLFMPAGCRVASLRTASSSRRAGAIAGVIKCTAPVRPPARRKAPPTPLQQRCATACVRPTDALPPLPRQRCTPIAPLKAPSPKSRRRPTTDASRVGQCQRAPPSFYCCVCVASQSAIIADIERPRRH